MKTDEQRIQSLVDEIQSGPFSKFDVHLKMNNPTASGGVSIARPDGESPPQADGVLTQRGIMPKKEKGGGGRTK